MALKVVSLFSGGGGLDLGFKSAGYEIVWAIDVDKNAAETYRANVGDIICADINNIDISLIPKADVVIGGPPCQSFSLAGNRNTEDARGRLVWKYISIIRAVEPRAFLFENVPGLLSAKNSAGQRIIDLLKKTFEQIGYTVSAKVVNAAAYGVPQLRKRVIIVGLKNGEEFVFPPETHGEPGSGLKSYVSVKEAIGDLPAAAEDENAEVEYAQPPFSDYQTEMRSSKAVTEHFIPRMSELDRYIIAHVKPGGNYNDIPKDVKSARIRRLQRDGGRTTCYGRLLPDRPSYTVNTYFNRPNVGCNIHYSEDRLITVREALRLQSFPDSYVIVSSSKQGRNLIVGNAVPPKLARAMAEQLKKYLEEDKMRISYSDSEVNVFHPVCEDALNAALKLIGKDGKYRVIHHRYTGTLEMDFCVQNIATGRYLCVVEVKRTPSDVSSMRYQYQAMSYVQTNSGNNERPFYILTNLEYANAFRYDPSRPGAYQQLLKPGLTEICRFEKNDAEEVAKKLGEYFKGVLSDFIANRYSYYSTLDDFAAHMRSVASKPKVWKSDLAVLLYEYIRGAFDAVGRNILKDVRLFHGDVEKICLEASKADFRGIFSYSPESFSPRADIDSALLSEVYAFGRQNISGDAVSGLLHQIVSEGNEHDGEVPTDLELGRIAAVLAKHISGGLGGGELICDPAAGSGNLISSAADVFGLTPKQIVANDIRPELLELLSLRLGLCFAGTVTPENSPTVECRSIAELDSEFFKDVRVVLMNPPFVAGINCEGKKAALLDKICRISGRRPVTSIGQMPLEGVFLELVTLLVQPGTTVACVLPKTHLMASGPEAGAIRKLISESFGLRAVFSYPGNGIFDGVTKDTCVIVGKIGQPAEYVSVISSYDSIPDIDTQMFAQVLNSELNDGFGQIMPGVVAKRTPLSELKEAASDGWRDLNSELADAVGFVNETLRCSEYLTELSECGFPIIRGRAGNNGASDLMFFDSREELYEKFKDRPGLVLKNAIRNATYDSFIIGGGDSRFLDVCNTDRGLADEIVEAYMRLPAREGRQKRNVKTGEDLIKILQREARGCFEANSVLIPRNIRTTGRVYLADGPVYVSTNFVVVTPPDVDSAAVLSTWISTVFYQVICEASSKDQEGTRKMEVGDISKTLVPDILKLPKGFIEKLKAARRGVRFTSLKSPEIRETDRLWAEFLFGDSAEAVLGRACETLSFLANRRDT